MAMDILGYELTDEQRAELEKAIADKQAQDEARLQAIADAANKPVEAQPGQAVDNQAKPVQETVPAPAKSLVDDDLAKWERKALKRLREGGRADVEFESDNISDEARSKIMGLLSYASSPETVKAIFSDYATSSNAVPVYGELVEALRDAAKAAREKVNV
jgi:hypothetical protein